MRTYLLYEIANSHGGSKDYIYKLIDSLPQEKNIGIKFQVFKYNEIALKDYDYYKVYVKFFIDRQNWKEIFTYAKSRGFDVWIDVFDLYSVEVLKNNLSLVTGIKMQSSVLDNLKVLKCLSETIRNKKVKVILNIAGREIDNIKETSANLKTNYFPKNEIILQAGFQGYPTDKEDLTVSKVRILKSEFPDTTISYADHVDGKSPLAFDIPVFAVLAGAEHIEKHVCLNRNKTKYDFQSAIEPHECANLIYKLKECEKILGTKLVPDKEVNYLKTTIEKPIAAVAMRAGDVINFKNFDFRRTGQDGLTVAEIKDLMSKRYILAKNIKPGKTISKNDIKKARIGVIIACRMKSTRLKHKAV
ncbi:MAG: N-acetylneuraminate synthase family protein, partial [Candidatus Staskawiczbacteria bacterium]|nr:N-acetylneuraminate synthase family protein [Candidatus Staskawiczbacteria bacterium]